MFINSFQAIGRKKAVILQLFERHNLGKVKTALGNK